ncbi:hypothetical protein BGW36DRAFT_207254 [Talaromyces proteolyticus]|uniref:Uncharacterized protein n=1 Tax=Talaromyces proteolyticus TaxID=1131652 RepID=A0AAD4KJ38_9EURO|nr:uncharacterized protein BGW36DRAFT_207254 [Talaromyces proteolyticus]KAH8693556.1 hypothetical protein BGW36DRAFT_207254 [Talaromyces proteolyticus]
MSLSLPPLPPLPPPLPVPPLLLPPPFPVPPLLLPPPANRGCWPEACRCASMPTRTPMVVPMGMARRPALTTQRKAMPSREQRDGRGRRKEDKSRSIQHEAKEEDKNQKGNEARTWCEGASQTVMGDLIGMTRARQENKNGAGAYHRSIRSSVLVLITGYYVFSMYRNVP